LAQEVVNKFWLRRTAKIGLALCTQLPHNAVMEDLFKYLATELLVVCLNWLDNMELNLLNSDVNSVLFNKN
jgi:hypothetical protein